MAENLVKIADITAEQLAGICDHTFLKRPEAYAEKAKPGEDPIETYKHAFDKFLDDTLSLPSIPYAVCVRPENVLETNLRLGRSTGYFVVASVVGFPDGTCPTDLKLSETDLAIKHGAKEIDMVLNHYDLQNEYSTFKVGEEISKVVKLAHSRHSLVKVILETSRLDPDEMMLACQYADEAGADFVKTSTGFSASGAKAEDLKMMRQYFPRGVKMSGGVEMHNVKDLLYAASGRTDGYINLDPAFIRIGESRLFSGLKADGKY